MEATKREERTKRGGLAPAELRVVAIEYRPAPDAEERLRRLVTILLNHASRTAPRPGDGDETEGHRGD